MALCLDGADDLLVAEAQGHQHEHEVQEEHGEAQPLGHLPLAHRDGNDHEHQHREQQHHGTRQPV